jgi:hypothetical protein
MIRSAAYAACAALAATLAFASPSAADPTPSPSPSLSPTATSAPSPMPLSQYSGQVLDVERGYIVFSTGAALRLSPDARFTDAASGQIRTAAIDPGEYAEATLDANGIVTAVAVSDTPITSGTPIANVPRAFVVQASPAYPNPDLIPPAHLFPVSKLSPDEKVTITVDVPPETPFSDDVYMATDTSGWNPEAVKLQRIDGRHFRMSVEVSPGTQFKYLFTRGSWATVESDAAGLRRAARTLAAQGEASLVIDATVQRWLDLP